MKEREQHLHDLCLWTSLEQTDHDESSEYIHFRRDLSTPAMSTDMSQVDVTLIPSF